ncbi:uncharacterized protein LOC128250517 [Octopus bimaculoides]|uniref:uncharacterized protein LOC128250517 n=1 Tax=Octopus bimaculoides TaxID=37653 RepID=UPI0022E3BB51|nr:uncharacterized protein LOC128250517 [Octopus bimaculoides]
MKGISVLLFCVFVSYTSGKQDVATIDLRRRHHAHRRNTSNEDTTPYVPCSTGVCYSYNYVNRPFCCSGYSCECNFIFRCSCNSKNMIHEANNGLCQTVIAFLIFLVNLPSY